MCPKVVSVRVIPEHKCMCRTGFGKKSQEVREASPSGKHIPFLFPEEFSGVFYVRRVTLTNLIC